MSVETLKNTTVSALLSACRLTVPDYPVTGRGQTLNQVSLANLDILVAEFVPAGDPTPALGTSGQGSAQDRKDRRIV